MLGRNAWLLGDASGKKSFLDYALQLVRENFVYNFHLPQLNYLSQSEEDFSRNFARFVNEANILGITAELTSARRDIAQNVNARMVFFDFALKMIVLLIPAQNSSRGHPPSCCT